MVIPFISDKCSAQIKRAANSLQLPIRVVTTPGRKLKDILTSSRPLDKPQCPHDDCRTCMALGEDGKCTDQNLVYDIKCGITQCNEANIGQYDGETLRPIDDRFLEHFRQANNPTAESHKNKPFAKHYRECHPNHTSDPQLKLKILARASSTIDRKIKESRAILTNMPDLNGRDELSELRKFLV